jgi:hypothetical protein
MSEEQAFRLLDDIRMRVDELEQEMVEA